MHNLNDGYCGMPSYGTSGTSIPSTISYSPNGYVNRHEYEYNPQYSFPPPFPPPHIPSHFQPNSSNNVLYVPYAVPVPMNQMNTWNVPLSAENGNRCPISFNSRNLEEDKDERRGKRKKRKRKTPERESDRKSTARTLGELVEEAKEHDQKKKKKRSRENSTSSESSKKDTLDMNAQSEKSQELGEQPTSNNESRPQFFDDVPMLTEKDLKEEIVLDECDFDPLSMKVKETASSALPVACEYYMENKLSRLNPTSENRLLDFRKNVLGPIKLAKSLQVDIPRPPTPPMHHKCKCGHDDTSSSSSSEEEGDENDKMSDRQRNLEILRKEVERKQNHPSALSSELTFNERGMGNDGPVCRCSVRAKKEGLRHCKYLGEKYIQPCDFSSSNSDRLYHYILKVGVAINTFGLPKSQIVYDNVLYTFEGYSIFFHRPLPDVLPAMPSSRWTTDFDFEFVQEPLPNCFTVGELESYYTYVFDEILDFYDINRYPTDVTEGVGCPFFHLMPRFIGERNGHPELLSMTRVLKYLTETFKPFLAPEEKSNVLQLPDDHFRRFIIREKNQLLLCPSKKPSAIRVDTYYRHLDKREVQVVQNTLKPLAYLAVYNPELHRLTKRLSKMKHLNGLKKNSSDQLRVEIEALQSKIESLKSKNNNIRCATVAVSTDLFYKVGLYPDVVPHALVVLLACQHARLHWSFEVLEKKIKHKFKNRTLLELALTHPSFKHNYGTTVDHAKNTLLNCGYKRKYATLEDKKEKKRGIFRLLEIMSLSGHSKSSISPVTHNERLEYLGDAVVEMVVSARLYLLLPLHNEGVLATYRSALVQNRNLAALAQNIGLQHWLLFAHGPDLCHESDFRHALANSFEAIMAAVYLDSGIDECDRIFSEAMFGSEPETLERWWNVPEEELRRDEFKEGDRELIPKFEVLQHLTMFEDSIGFRFKHIRLLAKAFTRRNIPYNCISKGNNQRLEWLGDTVLQLIVTDYLYKHFPYHHEGHLSLLRTCVVSNKTQSVICDDLNMAEYLVKPPGHREAPTLRIKDKADLVEAFIGALYLDGGLGACKAFIKVCFLPRLKLFIEANKWNDPKSQLQQLCLTMRNLESKEPAMPVYRVISAEGPSNTRRYKVAVYFRDKRLAVGEAGNMHSAEMEAARRALVECKELFPPFDSKQNNYKEDGTRNIPSLLSTNFNSVPYSQPPPFNGSLVPPLLPQPLIGPPPNNFIGYPNNPALAPAPTLPPQGMNVSMYPPHTGGPHYGQNSYFNVPFYAQNGYNYR